jgi:hypothetical protein
MQNAIRCKERDGSSAERDFEAPATKVAFDYFQLLHEEQNFEMKLGM